MGEPVTVDSDDLEIILSDAEGEVRGPRGAQACAHVRAALEGYSFVDPKIIKHYERWLEANHYRRIAAELTDNYARDVLTELRFAGLEVRLIEEEK